MERSFPNYWHSRDERVLPARQRFAPTAIELPKHINVWHGGDSCIADLLIPILKNAASNTGRDLL